MRSMEQSPRIDDDPFLMLDMEDFDIDAAFQEAVAGVASDKELQLDEKVRRMEVIVQQGTSELYQEFVDFRALAAQMEMACAHDHALGESMRGSDLLDGFMDAHTDDGHDHAYRHDHDEDEKGQTSTKKKKKKKRTRHSWFGIELAD